jgi:hypothetical protein
VAIKSTTNTRLKELAKEQQDSYLLLVSFSQGFVGALSAATSVCTTVILARFPLLVLSKQPKTLECSALGSFLFVTNISPSENGLESGNSLKGEHTRDTL